MSVTKFGPGIPFLDRSGRLTPEAARALNSLITRTGGTTGDITTTDAAAYPVGVITQSAPENAPVAVAQSIPVNSEPV